MKSKHQEIADAWVECRNAWTERDEAVEQLAAITAERDALASKLAALEKRIAEAPRKWTSTDVECCNGYYTALVRLEDGE